MLLATQSNMFNWFKSKKPKSLGQQGEEFAQGEYKKRGYKIVAANFFNKKGLRKGEVDFIAKNKKQIVFVEVKTRNKLVEKFGTGQEAVDIFKQRKLLQAVKIFLLQNPGFTNLQPQIDVCVVLYSELDNPPFSATILTNAVDDWN
jgi:putative endonuclease